MPRTNLSVMIFLPWRPIDSSIGGFIFEQPSWVCAKSRVSHRALLFLLASNGLPLLPLFHNHKCVALFAYLSSPPRSCWHRSIEIATYGFKHQLSFLGGNAVVRSLFHLWTTLFFFQRLADWSTSSINLDLVAAALYCESVYSALWSRTSYGVLIFDSAFKGFKHQRSSCCLWELHLLSHLTAFVFWLSACKLRWRSPLTIFILRLSV